MVLSVIYFPWIICLVHVCLVAARCTNDDANTAVGGNLKTADRLPHLLNSAESAAQVALAKEPAGTAHLTEFLPIGTKSVKQPPCARLKAAKPNRSPRGCAPSITCASAALATQCKPGVPGASLAPHLHYTVAFFTVIGVPVQLPVTLGR